MKAVGVNFPDVLIIEYKYQFKPSRPFAPGGEISGVVKSVGEGVTHIKPGDREAVMAGVEALRLKHRVEALSAGQVLRLD